MDRIGREIREAEERLRSWQSRGPSHSPFMPLPISEPFGKRQGRTERKEPPPVLPSGPYERQTVHPNDPEFMDRVRRLYARPYVAPIALDQGSGVVPFHHIGGHNKVEQVIAQYAADEARDAEAAARKEHERRLAAPWREGEWADDEAVTRAVYAQERVAWAEEAPDCWPESTGWEWCNVDHHAWCLDSGGGWCEFGESGFWEGCDRGWSNDADEGWLSEADLDGFLFAAWAEWCDEA